MLLVAKVCGPGPSCVVDAIPKAVQWAVDNRAQVISLSLGSQGSLSFLDKQGTQQRELTDA
ncbi:MAG: hypothetical protein LC623_08560, partial [Halobacteriales archaeon]|nr:hypothetical protein [Halobacteriales archaeon]